MLMILKGKLRSFLWEMPEVMIHYANVLTVEMKVGKWSICTAEQSEITDGAAWLCIWKQLNIDDIVWFVLQCGNVCCSVY